MLGDFRRFRLFTTIKLSSKRQNDFSHEFIAHIMSVETVTKIYMPMHETGEYLYGLKTVETKENDGKVVSKIIESFYVLKCAPASLQNSHLDFIGTLSKQRTNMQGISILLGTNERVIRLLKDGRELIDQQQVLLIYYDKHKFLNSYDAVQNATTNDDNFALVLAKALNTDDECENGPSTVSRVTEKLNNILIATTVVASTVLSVAAPAFKNTVIHRHCCNWKKCLVDKRTMNGFLLLDVMLGIMFFLIMNHIQHSGRYFMDSTEFIVNELRRLLEMLDGSPAGLKLNVQLNNFLLSCFMYHVDLWWNFIVIVEPAVHYLFFPITMFGLMGFSFQCAMLCDVITLITLHAHCFYIYAAMLYKLELSSIRSLLRIVLGRRLNVLKSKSKLCITLSISLTLIVHRPR